MTELNHEIAAQVAETCIAASEELGDALSRALGGKFGVKVGEVSPCDGSALPDTFDGAALAVLMHVGDRGIALVLPAATGLVPTWCAAPDPTQDNLLKTLAQELGMLVLPAALEATDCRVQRLSNAAAALTRAKLDARAVRLSISLTSGEATGELSVVWPLEAPDEFLEAAELVLPTTPSSLTMAEAPPSETPPKARDLSSLPGYSRSLLKISVPVSVQLASKKESVHEVLILAPGSIIKFEKGCEELLQMIVGEHTVAEGEAVKIGEKFGFRVTSMKLPPEHFVAVKKRRA